VDCIAGSVVDARVMEEKATKPVQYIVAFDNEASIKDVTVRYASDWLIATRKLRVSSVDQHWWKDTLNPFKTSNEVIFVKSCCRSCKLKYGLFFVNLDIQ